MTSGIDDLFGAAAELPAVPTPKKRSGKAVLVVDDSDMMRLTITRIVEKSGHRVIEASNGNQALDACRNNTPDLIFLDWIMPDKDGLETLQEMRQMPKLRDTAVVLLTVVRDKNDIRVTGRFGVTDYISKPTKPDRVREKIHKYLGS
jgi:CheY-like chemotaxis protein